MELINGKEMENYFVEWDKVKSSYHIVAGAEKHHIFGLGGPNSTAERTAYFKSFLEYFALHLNYAFAQGFFNRDGFVIYDNSSFVKILDDKYKEWTILAEKQ